MKIYTETSLRDFTPWAGAIERYNRFTYEELDTIEQILEDINFDGEGFSETAINDMFWFDDDWLLEILEIEYDEFWSREG